jgi:hypothetical protein
MTTPRHRAVGPRWYREVLYIAVFYGAYTLTRNSQGSAKVSTEMAFHNAKKIVRLERGLGMFHEESIQQWFLGWRRFLQFWNVYYGSAHFVVTIAALVWCFFRAPHRYARARNALAAMTALALIGFAVFPLMPPRLMPTSYGFVDTLRVFGGLWNFDSGAIAKVSNQYAAMPSLHFGWASWCTLVWWPAVEHRAVRILLALYPFFTLFAIVVTANHYFLDAAGGLVVFLLGVVIGRTIADLWQYRSHPIPRSQRSTDA